ncbi:MAG TPA: CHAT domain-containing tetratricopeptide repeat protein [Pyrinomonadaceae bacterium]|nr:CHAT domain-containing tetratricopeptide repeat protein [Pyrinomonadaceae bacterium]
MPSRSASLECGGLAPLLSRAERDNLSAMCARSARGESGARPRHSKEALLLGIVLLCAIPALAQQDPLTAGRAAYAEAERARLANPAQREQAIKKYEEAIEFYRAAGERAGEASALTNIGVVYNQLGERQKALEYLNQALSLHKLVGNQREEARTFTYMAYASSGLVQRQKALEYFNQALRLSEALGDGAGEAQALANISGIYNALGEPQKSLDYLSRALVKSRAVGDRAQEARTVAFIGGMHNQLGDGARALEYLNEALRLYIALGDRAGEGLTITNIGFAYTNLKDWPKALEYFNLALPIVKEVDDRRWTEGMVLTSIGRVKNALGNNQEALQYLNEALAIHRSLNSRIWEAHTLTYLGGAYDSLGQPEKALDYFNQALALTREIAHHNGQAASLLRIARIERSRGKLSEARQRIETALEINESLRTRVVNQESRTAFSASRREYYEFYVDLLMRMDQKAEALQANERARARSLLETLSESRVQSEIRAGNPRHAALTHPVPLTLRDIQQQVLDEQTMLLEYALGQEKSYLWVVTKSELKSFELPKRSIVEAVARRVYELLMVSNNTQARRPAELALGELGRMLLGPAANLLTKERIVIVADGALDYVPFTALSIDSAYEPLIARHEVISLPSASVLDALRRETANRQRAPEALAVLADAVFQSNDSRLTQLRGKAHASAGDQSELMRSAADAGVVDFPRLPFSRREAEAIVAKAGESRSLKALDFTASRETVFNTKLDQYRIIHFATHALLNSQHPALSGIVLSLYDDQGRPIDGFVRAHEIYNLKLNADLVVLSGCRTALGSEIKGEGLVGLTRGFMYAGTPSVVASLWDVRDKATSELMSRFYERMFKERRKPAAALRAAQVSMWKERRWSAPYYWAGFILQGEWR